ncbi:hypothetical protein LIER_07154 [Lithospermum erythrorhizon]|uniref:Uncharacterized protein n=1 Tax=Lithospermum erythrorhizon TaxID=34254 RepID=A0AAV3P7B6_LITER
MNWTPGAPSRAYILAGRGHTRDKPPKIYRVLREDVATERWSWNSLIALHGLLEYTLGYWDWAEDVLNIPATVTKDVQTATNAETMLSSEARTEIVDSDKSSDCMVTEEVVTGSPGNGAQAGVVDVEEPSDCVITKAVDVAVPAASLFTRCSAHRVDC